MHNYKLNQVYAAFTSFFQVNPIAFWAPELLLGSNSCGKPIDIWAVGCIFAEMVEGKRLFGSGDVLDTEISILYETFRYLISLDHSVNSHFFPI